MINRIRNWLILSLSIPAAVILAIIGLLVFQGLQPLPPIKSLPNPNGYDDLVKAGQMIKGDVWDYDKASLEKLRGIVSTNAEALALARSALSNQCGVPLQFTKAHLKNHIHDFIAIRSLAQATLSEGKLAEKENFFNEAANSYLDAVRLGNGAGRGGILGDEMLGAAIWSMGVAQLQTIATNLDAPTCRNIATTLETLTADRQTWAVTMQQEEAWLRRAYGWRGEWLKWIYHSARQKNHRRVLDVLNGDARREGKLLLDLAARAYELDKGHQPASLSDLVPDYLKAIPQDPLTGKNMSYTH